jgi:small subunit ribosomal protein S4
VVPGQDLWGRTGKSKKNYRPGQHGPNGQVKTSDYGNQLKAKQKMQGYYGIRTERQFRNIFHIAYNAKGDTGDNLVGLLECKIDALVYRMNLAPTIFAAAQLVSHGHVLVDGRPVNRYFFVKVGQEVSLKEESKKIALVLESVQRMERSVPDYLSFDTTKMVGTLTRVPKLADVPYPVQMEPNLVTEFYSQ